MKKRICVSPYSPSIPNVIKPTTVRSDAPMSIFTGFKRILFFIVFIPLIAFGQATLKGTVTDGATNDPLIGVNVTIQGTSLCTATDIDGWFVIFGIPERALDVKISCVGYEPLIRKIDFSKAKETSRKFQLKSAVIEGEEVVVTGQARGQQAAINQQLAGCKCCRSYRTVIRSCVTAFRWRGNSNCFTRDERRIF